MLKNCRTRLRSFPVKTRDPEVASLQQRLEKLDTTLPGISSAERVELRGSSARVANGTLGGTITLGWDDKQFRAQGELNLKGADLAQLLPAFTREFQSTGLLEAAIKFSS